MTSPPWPAHQPGDILFSVDAFSSNGELEIITTEIRLFDNTKIELPSIYVDAKLFVAPLYLQAKYRELR